MKRRVLAGAAVTALAATLVPATPAFASAAATAALTGTTAVYPGDRTFSMSVTNNEMPVIGKTINAIRVNFPVNEAGIRLGGGAGTAAGCTEATPTNLGTTQFITYRGCSLRPGSSLAITFPAAVGAPLAKDLLGDFRVAVSSDNFATSKPAAGSLIAKVQVLEILQEGLTPLTPTDGGSKGVTDRTGTAGQAITYGSTVKNYSRSALSVTAALTSNGGDTVTPATISVPAGGTASASIPVALSDTAGARTFTASAVATDAQAPAKTDSFTVQAPALLTPSSLDGTRVKSGTGSARDFTVTLSKTGAQALDAVSATLSFGSNSCPLVGAPTFAAGDNSQPVTFRCTSIAGTDGALPASVSYTVKDDNLATYGRSVSVGNIVIDNLSPLLDLVVALPNDADGDKQTAVSNGDQITVSGNITNAGDLAGSTVRVVLTPDVGDSVVVNAPISGTGDTRTYSGTASPTWDAKASRFTASSSIADTAGNSGGATAPSTTVIDNAVPVLRTPGTITSPTTIEVEFLDATGVRGGCTTNLWLVDGQPGRVSEVRTGDGKPCNETASNTRVLVLSSPLTADDTPDVTYDPTAARTPLGNRRPAKDGAGTDVVRTVIDTVTRLAPDAPQIVSLERRDSASTTGAFEGAYLDPEDGRYYTNIGGTDALRLTVAGVKQNYAVEVLRGGTVVASRRFTAAPSLGASSYNGDVLVPLPTTDGPVDFTVRLVSAAGNAGLGTPFVVVLDRVAPALRTPTISGSTVTQTFSDKIVLGSDFADNWFVSEMVAGENGPVRRTVNVDTVTADGSSTRLLQVSLLDATKFAGIDYFQQSGTRYEDRAGNALANTLVAS